ncbi:MAG: hypothetical protein WB767_06150 [Nocardioides sp.]
MRPLVRGLLLSLAACLVALVCAQGAPAGAVDGDPDDVFAGRVQRVQTIEGPKNRPDRPVYTVLVMEVYGESEIDTGRVTVHTSAAIDKCTNLPTRPGDQPYFFTLDRQGVRLVATQCSDVRPATESARQRIIATYGEPRPAVMPDPEPVLPEVTYTCPESEATLSDVERASTDCEELSAPSDLDRAAAPGLALILIGLLGLLVVRRVSRTRH